MNTEQETLRIALIDMERKLIADDDGSYRKTILEKLQKYQVDVQSHIANGLPPEEFSVYAKLKQALLDAQKIITNF